MYYSFLPSHQRFQPSAQEQTLIYSASVTCQYPPFPSIPFKSSSFIIPRIITPEPTTNIIIPIASCQVLAPPALLPITNFHPPTFHLRLHQPPSPSTSSHFSTFCPPFPFHPIHLSPPLTPPVLASTSIALPPPHPFPSMNIQKGTFEMAVIKIQNAKLRTGRKGEDGNGERNERE